MENQPNQQLNQQPEQQNQSTNQPLNSPPANQVMPTAPITSSSSGVRKLERITAVILITTGIFFAVIAILAIWGLLGDSGELIPRTLGTLGVIAFVALIINVGARLMEDHKK
jgi:hypothetical protein